MKAIFSKTVVTAVSYFFMVLFMYAAVSKMRAFENFQVQLAQSPLLSAYAGFISYGVILLELVIAGVLAFPKARRVGLYASFGLMVAFTVYIYLILNYSDFVPCSCGGILEKMGWTEHLIFNVGCVVMAFVAIVFIEKEGAIPWCRTAAVSSLIVIISAGGIVALFLSSEYIMKKENNFIRRFVPHPINNSRSLDLKADTFYFAGNHGDTLYLGNTEAPLLMVQIKPVYTSIHLDTLKISDYKLPFKNVVLDVEYPYFNLSDGTVPVIFEGKFPDMLATKVEMEKVYFSKIKMAVPQQYLCKAILSDNLEGVIGLINTKYKTVQLRRDVLEKQRDGLFDTDGDFQIEKSKKKFIYTYFYRNQYITTNLYLNDKSTGNTIDTTNKARIHLKKLSTGITKMNAPPVQVNQTQAMHGSKLYNVSKLRGRYESGNRWKDAKIVDVYDYERKIYDYSFYVYNRNENSMRSMIVTAKYFYILIGNEILRYERNR